VKLLTNPLVLRMALVLFAAVFAFLIGTVIIRRMRRSLVQEADLTGDPPSDDALPLHTYHAVIQQLKQQKHELQTLQQAERRRAKTSENLSAAVLSNLSCGVMFFNPSGLIRQANGAAKRILGFASPLGMNPVEVFRQATMESDSETGNSVAQAIEGSLREKTLFRRFSALYTTPSGEERALEIILTSVQSPGGEALGTACLINDQTEIADIRRQQELRGEMSGEMALELRNSLTTISGYAQQLAANRDPELTHRLAADIAAEAAHLDSTIGGFLAGARAAAAEA
jgi:nitrogen fixation/metabolism regulation signal transduction histidine kinase